MYQVWTHYTFTQIIQETSESPHSADGQSQKTLHLDGFETVFQIAALRYGFFNQRESKFTCNGNFSDLTTS